MCRYFTKRSGNHFIKRFGRCAFLLLVMLACAAFFLQMGPEGQVSAAKKKPSLNKTSVTLSYGGTCSLKVRHAPKKAKITWRSADRSVATVTKSGKVRALDPGKTVIRAKFKGKTLKCTVTVRTPELVQPLQNLTAGESVQLKVLNNKKAVTWLSSNPEIASVSDQGIVTGTGQGVVRITASFGSRELEAQLRVLPGVPAADQVCIEFDSLYGIGKFDVPWGSALFEDMDACSVQLAWLATALTAAAGPDTFDRNAVDYYAAKAHSQLGLITTLYNFKEEATDFPGISHRRTQTKSSSAYDTSDEHCFTIGWTDMQLGGQNTHVLILSLRGTNEDSIAEISGDVLANCNQDLQGRKIYNYWNTFSDKVIQGLALFVQDHPELKTGPVKLLIGGHSLGGGAANILGARFDYALAGFEEPSLDAIGWEGPQSPDDILVISLGGLNVFDRPIEKLSDDAVQASPDHPCADMFRNIKNIFNEWDTYGPKGEGTTFLTVKNFKPGLGGESCGRKFGTLKYFMGLDYREIFNRPNDATASHRLQGYVRSLQLGAVPFWNEIYYAHVKAASLYGETAFDLRDLDEDGTPELIACGEDGTVDFIYTVRNGQLAVYGEDAPPDGSWTMSPESPKAISARGWETFIQTCADAQPDAHWSECLQEHYR